MEGCLSVAYGNKGDWDMAASGRKRNSGRRLMLGNMTTGEIRQVHDRHRLFYAFRRVALLSWRQL